METDLYIVNIDTRYKTDPNSNAANYTYSLVTPLKNISSIKLSSLEFPNVNYIFSNSKNSNTFTIIYDGQNIPITIPEGIYSPCSIVDAINLKFTNMTTASYSSGTTTHFKMYYNSSTFKTIIMNDKPFGINFDNTYPDGTVNNNKSLGTLLGFRQNLYSTPTNIPVISTLANNAGIGYISESVLDTQGDTYILVKINNYGNIIHDSVDAAIVNGVSTLVKKTDNYFAKILLYGQKGTIIFDTSANFITKTVNLRQPENISKLQITLYEPNGDIIQLLNFDYSLTLEFTYILSSALKTKSNAGLLDYKKLDVAQPNIQAPGVPQTPIIEKFKGLSVEDMFEKKPTFRPNRYLQEKERKYKQREEKEKLVNTYNKTTIDYTMANPSIVVKDKKKKKKKTKKTEKRNIFNIDYS